MTQASRGSDARSAYSSVTRKPNAGSFHSGIFPGMDWRHPPALAEHLARIPKGRLVPVALSAEVRKLEDFARAWGPAIRDFVIDTRWG